MAIADVTVRGAGVFGLSVAYACAQRGAKVRVIDPRGVAAGASGGIVGALAPHVPENWNRMMRRWHWPSSARKRRQSFGTARRAGR